MLKYDFIDRLAKKYGTPFYLMYPDRFKENIESFQAAFKKHYPQVVLGYSFKTNYVPDLLRVVLDVGSYAEVVSDFEYDLALQMGFSPDKIIFNGPIKSYDSLLKAMRNKSIVNIDALYEAEQLISIRKKYPDLEMAVGLRINMEIKTEDGTSAIQDGLLHSRFGLTVDDLNKAIPMLRSAGIRIISVHGHTSSTNRVVRNYEIISRTMLSVCEEYELDDICYFDLGGGFFGAAPEGLNTKGRPTYQDYAESICSLLLANKWFKRIMPSIVIEPGTSVVANVFDVVTKIYQHKMVCGKNYVVVDAGILNVKPITSKVNYLHRVISDKPKMPPIYADVVGSTCMERDIILHDVELANYSYGDYIHFRGVGAYILSMTPIFINYLFPIISLEKGTCKLVRRKQTLRDVLAQYE